MEKKTKTASGKWLLPLLARICLLSVLVMTWALTKTTEKDSSAFTPPPFEENAEQGEPKVPQELGYSLLDAEEYQVSVCGAPVVQDGEAVLYLTNPSSNEVWLKVRILDEDGQLLGESGILKPGEYVKSVSLSAVPKEDTAVQLKLMAYEPDTYYSAGAASLSTTLYAAAEENAGG
ncbi:MAG: hypothetical protein Q4C91_21450 [Eubacteriales bacterium]|nr:hypothetical protein [Eubacteriales bacterium]